MGQSLCDVFFCSGHSLFNLRLFIWSFLEKWKAFIFPTVGEKQEEIIVTRISPPIPPHFLFLFLFEVFAFFAEVERE